MCRVVRAPLLVLVAIVLGPGLAGSAGPARAAAPFLLRDIHATGVDRNHAAEVTGPLLPLGRRTLVPMTETSSGQELWVTDGTDAGTRLLLDLCPGPCGTAITPLGVIDGVGVFFASFYSTGPERTSLWRSNGTLLGTFPLIDRQDLEFCSRPEPPRITIAGSKVFFPVETDACGLWATDGTVAGTVLLRDFPDPFSISRIDDLTAAGTQVFFVSSDEQGIQLWKSDGTPEGTAMLRSWADSRGPESLVAAGDRLFFALEEEGYELWTSNGTAAGTRSLTRFAPAAPFAQRYDSFANQVFVFQALDGALYFPANDGTSGVELWRSDGTPAGTRPVTEFSIASPFIFLQDWRIEKLGNRLIFGAHDGVSGFRLWTTDGRPESTARIDGCPGGCPVLAPDDELVRLGSKVYFTSNQGTVCNILNEVGNDLWATDGTGPGTRRVADFCECCQVARLQPLHGQLFFVAQLEATQRFDLWGSDGTPQGTRSLIPTEESRWQDVLPFRPVDAGEQVLLAVSEGATDPTQLWASDGTPETTRRVAGIGRNGQSSLITEIVPAGNGVRFYAYGGEHFTLWSSGGTAATTQPLTDVPFFLEHLASFGNLTLGWGDYGLWRTDGTPAGTFRLLEEGTGNGVTEVATLPGRALFVKRTSGGGTSLWTTDGTVAGTRELLVQNPYLLTPLGDEIFFIAEGALWASDGTSGGTRPLTPGNVQPAGRMARLGSIVYFPGAAGSSESELWRTDGTTAGTHPVTEDKALHPRDLITHRGAVYFMADERPFDSRQGLWRSDGTEGGTVFLRGFTGARDEAPRFTSLGNFLLFTATDANGTELWRTNGTPEGTVRVRDIAPREASSSPTELTVLAEKVYFAAYDEDHGIELWGSDGTAQGTHLVQDIAPGPLSSAPQDLVTAGGRLYFTADDGVHGREPWVYAPGGAGCVASEFVLCLSGGRFKVEADWRDFQGGSGRGRAVTLTADTGYFWFFSPANVEVILKVLDGRGFNGHQWVFYGALSSVEYSLTVTDTETGAARRYFNQSGRLGSVADTQAFGPQGASAPGVVTTGPAPELGEAIVASRTTEATGSCAPSATRLCLNGGRFTVEARWKAQGQSGTGKAVPLTGGDTGYFWFFDANNVEVVLKVLDGRPVNGKFWVFYGALSDVEYTVTVTDTQTGAVRTYTNPSGRLASVADTGAF